MTVVNKFKIVVRLGNPGRAVLEASLTLFIGLGFGVRRRRQVVAQLPGWIDVLARSLRTGRSLEQALIASLQKLKKPLSTELRRCADLLELGLRVDDSFRDLGSRYRSLDLQMVISAMSMNRQTGGDLPATLERLAIVARQRLESRRQAQAASSSARFAAICLAAAPPGIFLYYLTTGQFVTHLFSDPSGKFALALALGLELVGIGWLLFLARTED